MIHRRIWYYANVRKNQTDQILKILLHNPPMLYTWSIILHISRYCLMKLKCMGRIRYSLVFVKNRTHNRRAVFYSKSWWEIQTAIIRAPSLCCLQTCKRPIETWLYLDLCVLKCLLDKREREILLTYIGFDVVDCWYTRNNAVSLV